MLDITGQVNPLARPLALDIQAKATDLELAPLSPYAGKYAGYAIERGKLSMDVAYKIDADGRLEARNQVILNQLTFGDADRLADGHQAAGQAGDRAAEGSQRRHRHQPADQRQPQRPAIQRRRRRGQADRQPAREGGDLAVRAARRWRGRRRRPGHERDRVPARHGRPSPTRAPRRWTRWPPSLKDRPALQMTITGSADAQAEGDRLAARGDRVAAAHAGARRGAPRGRAGERPRARPPRSRPRRARRLLKTLYKQTRLPDKPRNLVGPGQGPAGRRDGGAADEERGRQRRGDAPAGAARARSRCATR